MVKFISAIFILGLTLASASAADTPSFAVGQKWSIKDSGITIVIGAVEPFSSDKTAVSISVFDVPCPAIAGCATTNVAHAPFDSHALEQSVDQLIATQQPLAPAYAQGYENWKNAKGGIFTIPVSRLPDLLFQALSTGKPVPEQPGQKQ